jgi:lipopolysaccharide export system protein LptA
MRNRLLRAALLVALVSGVGGLTALFLQGREERAAAKADAGPEETVEVVEEPEAVTETAQLSAEEFESTLEREGIEVFRIRGAQTSSDDQGNVNLSQVEVAYPQGDDHYSLRADGATYNEETSATHLEGSVALQGTNGLAVDADWLELAAGGMVLTAADDSRFRFEGVTVQGDDLRMDFREEIARMGGGVRLVGAEESESGVEADPSASLSLAAETLEYRWREGIVRALGGAEMEIGRFTLVARSLTLHEGEAGGLTGLEARGEIELRAPLETTEPDIEGAGRLAGESTLVLRGDALDVQFDDAQSPSRVDLSGPSWGGPAVLRIDYGDGSQRRVRARLLEFNFLEGVLAEFSSRGRVELHELVPDRPRPLRQASSVVAAGRFDEEGVLVELTLGGNVELTDRSETTVFARAEEATIDPSTQRVDFRGQPARLVLSQGELEGNRVLFDQGNRCAEASGGVRLTLDGSSDAGAGALPFGRDGSDAGASVITAGEALLCEAGESRFRDGVEVRRGPDLLAAAQVRITEDRRQMVANGDVRTVWHSQPLAQTATAGETGTEGATERWSISAARMNYDEDGGELRYSGGAAAVLGEQNLECDELTIEAIPGDQDSARPESGAQTLFCLGSARLDDPGYGRSVEANRAVYAFVERVIRFTGNVVFRGGTDELRGPGLNYWIDERRYEMRPSGSAAAGAAGP